MRKTTYIHTPEPDDNGKITGDTFLVSGCNTTRKEILQYLNSRYRVLLRKYLMLESKHIEEVIAGTTFEYTEKFNDLSNLVIDWMKRN